MNDDQPQQSSQRDIQLTAYALGELNDAEQAVFAATCDEAERIVAGDIARLGKLLRRAAREDVCPARSDDLHRVIEARLTEREAAPSVDAPPITLPPTFWPRRRVWLPLSLAASLLVVAATFVALLNLPADVPQVAKNDFQGTMVDGLDATLSVEGLSEELEDVDRLHRFEGSAPVDSGVALDSEGIVYEESEILGAVVPPAGSSADTPLHRSRSSVTQTQPGGTGPMTGPGGMKGSGASGGAAGAPSSRARYAGAGGESDKLRRLDGGRGSSDGEDDYEKQESQGPERRNLGIEGKQGVDSDYSYSVPGKHMGPGGTLGNNRGEPGGSGSDGKRGYQGAGGAPGKDRYVRDEQISTEQEAREQINGDLYSRHGTDDMSGVASQGSGKSDSPDDARDGIVVGGRELSDRKLGLEMRSNRASSTNGGPETRDAQSATPDSLGRASGAHGEISAGAGFQPISGGALRFGDLPALSDTETYAPITENAFLASGEHPLSTFSIDVDTASYANVRRFINTHALPPPNAVRIEELINYFSYDYPQPEGDEPFSVTTEVAGCPWNAEHRLLRVGLKGRALDPARRPASNLVFLLDVSGSMDEPNKLPLVKEALQLLSQQLSENDRVAIVVYAGNSGLVLPPTRGNEREKICAAIASLTAGGSTNGGQGIQLAYDAAQAHFVPGGTNRVILATDGDFNVGVTDTDDLVRLIEEKAAGGVGLSALGFGGGNLKDATLEKLADRGNGNYAYIDTVGEARKVLVEQLCGTLVTIAKDVKLQVEFNPAQVGAYRLIGYENRILREQDFNDDRKDAGEIGAGHAVTALYELVPEGKSAPGGVDALKYQRVPQLANAAARNELATLKLRYKPPEGEKSKLLEHVISDTSLAYGRASTDFKFAASVALCGMLLRGSQYAGNATWDAVVELAGEGISEDTLGYRAEFLELVRKAKAIVEK